MRLAPFALERWFARYEFAVRINLGASCAPVTSTTDLLASAGTAARESYLSLELDYIPNTGGAELRREIAGLYQGLETGDIQVTTGASEAIFLLMSSTFQPGENIIVQQPAYQSLSEVARAAGVEIRAWPLKAEPEYAIDLALLERLIDERSRAVVINNPHNPTGFVMSHLELAGVVELVDRHDLLLVSDEVYRGITHRPEDELPPAAGLTPRAVSIGDMTKPFGLGGLRIGWLACRNRKLLDRCGVMRDYTTMCSAGPAEFLAALALQHRESLLAQKRAVARANLAILGPFMEERQAFLSWQPPRGGFTVFPRYSFPMDSESLCRGLAEEKSVLLLPGSVFGWERHFRLGLGVEPGRFRWGLELFGEYLDTLV